MFHFTTMAGTRKSIHYISDDCVMLTVAGETNNTRMCADWEIAAIVVMVKSNNDSVRSHGILHDLFIGPAF